MAHASLNGSLDGADFGFPFFAPVTTALKVGWEQVLNKRFRCFALGLSRWCHVSLRHTAIVEARNMLILRFKCVTVQNEESGSRMALNDWCTVELVVAIVPFGDRNWAYRIHYLDMDFHREFPNLHILYKVHYFFICRGTL